MTEPPFGVVLRYLRRLTVPVADSPVTDRELLRRFRDLRDQPAFETLVCRHGPMVLGVCRRLLGHSQDVDDGFQATFLILVRKAGSLAWQESLGGWLHEVAYRVALKLRALGRRETTVSEAAAMQLPDTHPEACNTIAHVELHQVLDEELQQLPAKYRQPLVLCYLEGKTHEEAALELGWPRGSMARRLSRAQELLKSRLVGRGVAPAAAGGVGLLAAGNATAAVSASLQATTLAAAGLLAAGGELSQILSPRIPGLIEGVLEMMSASKVKTVLTVLAVLLILTGGTGWFWPRQQTADLGLARAVEPDPPAANQPAAVERKPLLVWSGAHSEIAEITYRRITSAKDWETLWQAHAGKAAKETATSTPPEIDFAQCMVVAIFQGATSNSRGVQLVSLQETAGTITLRFDNRSYQTINGFDAVTPFGVILLPRSAKAVILEENVQNLLGRPPVWKERSRFEATAAVPLPERPALPVKPALTPLVLAERLQQIADDATAKNHPFREQVVAGAKLLLRKDTNPPRLFEAPDLTNPQQVNDFLSKVVERQKEIVLSLFQLDACREELTDLQENLGKEPAAWQAQYLYIRASLAARAAFLYEYNAQLGQLRKQLPALDNRTQQGWQLTAGKEFLDQDAAKQATTARTIFEQLAKDHAQTKWAEMAQDELGLLVGLRWEPYAKQ